MSSCNISNNDNKYNHVVKTDIVKTTTLESEQKFAFISKPNHTTELSFRVGGQIKYFDSFSGSYFKKGDIIAKIDDRDYIIRAERTESIYNQAKAEYERVKILYNKNNISASTFDKSHADYVTAKTSYEIAKNELLDTKLAAPFNGYIGNIYIERHQDVNAAQAIVSLVDIDKIRIEVYISQEIAMMADKIEYVNLRFDAIPNKTYRAKVANISKNTTDNSLSYLLTALLPNNDAALLPGMSGEVIFDIDKSNFAVIVPQTAVSHRPNDGDYVWCIDPASRIVSKRVVILGSLLPNGMIEIKHNLKGGEMIATSGLRFLSDGIKVTL